MLSFLGTTCFFCFEETERVVGWGCLELKFLFSRKLGAGKRIPEKFRKFFFEKFRAANGPSNNKQVRKLQ